MLVESLNMVESRKKLVHLAPHLLVRPKMRFFIDPSVLPCFAPQKCRRERPNLLDQHGSAPGKVGLLDCQIAY